jgi:hypothetical protein
MARRFCASLRDTRIRVSSALRGVYRLRTVSDVHLKMETTDECIDQSGRTWSALYAVAVLLPVLSLALLPLRTGTWLLEKLIGRR